MAITLLAIGVLLFMVGGPWRDDFISPGPLISAHASLQCASCHGASGQSVANWLKLDSSMNSDEIHSTDSDRCLACHELGVFANLAHSTSSTQLAQWKERTLPNDDRASESLRLSLAHRLRPTGVHAENEFKCAECHREHQGNGFDLASMTEQRCQSCHTTPFRSFSNGHPEFSDTYPSSRRPRLAFNHVTHLKQYFQDPKLREGSSVACQSCHSRSESGAMLTADFETSCGSCHQHTQQIQGRGLEDPAIAFFRLPALDLAALESHNVWIGDRAWPSDANIGDEGDITPFMELLLTMEDDQSIVEDLAYLRSRQLSLSHLRSEESSGAEASMAAGRIIWAIKSLVFELTEGDLSTRQDSLDSRLARTIGVPSLSATLQAALTGVPMDVPVSDQQRLLNNLRTMRNRWLPDLEIEVPAYRSDRSLILRESDPRVTEPPVAIPQETPPADVVSDEDLFGEEEDDDLFADDEASDDDLLDDTEDDLFAEEDESEDDLFAEEEDDASAISEPAAAPATDELERQIQQLQQEFKSTGRWSLQEYDYSLRYRPVGHADAFLESWIDTSIRLGNTAPNEIQTPADLLLKHLMRSDAPGRCGRCHSLDIVTSDFSPRHVVHWRSWRPAPDRQRITRFNHTPHLQLTSLSDCRSCHALVEESGNGGDWEELYENADPDHFLQSFRAIDKTLCLQCHQPQQAGESCLSCHRYHAGPKVGGFSR